MTEAMDQITPQDAKLLKGYQVEADGTATPLYDAPRRHPEVFRPLEAALYLGFDSVESLETLRREFGLVGHRPAGKGYLYHKRDLDACALRMFGKAEEERKRRGGKR